MLARATRYDTTQDRTTPLLAVLVEGESDYSAVRVLLQKAGITRIVRIKFGSQPVECSVSLLVERTMLRYIRVAELKGAHRIIILLDREWRERCAPGLAGDVLSEILRQMRQYSNTVSGLRVRVVCPDHCLENWLIADPEGLSSHAYIVRSIARKVGSIADSKPAIEIIKWAFRKGRSYHKARDAPALARSVDVLDPAVRRRSKSLDKFLREAGVPPLE